MDDIAVEGSLYVCFVRSDHAHAEITGIDTSQAASMEGVVAVFTGADLGDAAMPMPNPVIELVGGIFVPILAETVVRAVGSPVVAVVAISPSLARDAAEAVDVKYKSLNPVVGFEAASASTPLLPGLADNRLASHRWTCGEPDKMLGQAATRVAWSMTYPRLAPCPMEPRASLALWDSGSGILTAWLGTQTPHRARADIAAMVGLPLESVRVIAPDVGGAFGGKASVYPEDLLLAWAAHRLSRPVRWTASRGEDFLSATHGRGAEVSGELAVDDNGRMVALRATVRTPLGCWLPYSALVPAWNSGRILPGPYAIDDWDVQVEACMETLAPVGIYRGAGRPEAAMLMERLIDEAARSLDMDPAEMRRINLVASNAMPLARGSGQVLDSGNYATVLNDALQLCDYTALKEDCARRRASGEICGIGLSFYVEPSGQGWETAAARLMRDGRIEVASGSTAQGQGRDTAIRQIAAELLACAPETVTTSLGDTHALQDGIGSLASRSTPIGGSALKKAVEDLREGAASIAALLLNCEPEAVRLTEKGFGHGGRENRLVSWAEVARQATRDRDPREEAPAIEFKVTYEAKGEAWGNGCYVALVGIDGDTGVVTVERMTCIDDAGRLINPRLVEDQVVGAVAQGLGEALLERVVYDDDGQLLTGSFMDYALPRASDMPAIAIGTRETPSPFNDLGAKGVGEAGCIGAPPAILNAVIDALGPVGARALELPLSSERVWRALVQARKQETAQ